MDKQNSLWPSIRRSLNNAKRQSLFVLALVALVFPIVESVLTESWSSTPLDAKSVPGWTLAFVVVIHVILGTFLLIEQFSAQPNALLARAYEIEENSSVLQRELERREAAYRILRDAFERLNTETCNIEFLPSDDAWCRGGFQKCLTPILQPFIDEAALALGVVSNKFTLEVYYQNGFVPVNGRPEIGRNGLCQQYFYGAHVNRCDGVCLPANCSPAKQCVDAGNAFTHHIDQNKHLYYEGDKRKRGTYFRRYAACPITESCSPKPVGVLILTSEQDSEFADDVLDVLAFLGTLISSYVNSYQRCFLEHNLVNESVDSSISNRPEDKSPGPLAIPDALRPRTSKRISNPDSVPGVES